MQSQDAISHTPSTCEVNEECTARITNPMPTHDIIDNRNAKLVDSSTTTLGQTELARFAVGYFFISGLESISKALGGHVKELRLLIGSTTNSKTIEQMAEGHRRLA